MPAGSQALCLCIPITVTLLRHKSLQRSLIANSTHSPSAFCYSHTELYSQHLDGGLHRSAGTNLWHQEMRQSRSQAQAAVPGWRAVPLVFTSAAALQATIVSWLWTLCAGVQALWVQCQALAERGLCSSVSDKSFLLALGEGRAGTLPLLEGVTLWLIQHIWFVWEPKEG